MHSIYFNYNHSSFANVWTLNNQREVDHTLRNQNQFFLQFPRTDNFKKSPLYSFAKLWNDLPGELKGQENPYTFKISTKENLFRQIQAECQLLP